jgi:catechol 2,3-dioxygenase-like lactoylglutathione lyase family enzyme
MLSDHPVFPILLAIDMAASRAFYHETLGLELGADTADRVVVKCGGGTWITLSLSTIGTSDTQTQVGWRVPDIHAAIADLRSRGVTIEEYDEPKTVDGVADMGHSWAAWFIDPGRNVLSVVQPKG